MILVLVKHIYKKDIKIKIIVIMLQHGSSTQFPPRSMVNLHTALL